MIGDINGALGSLGNRVHCIMRSRLIISSIIHVCRLASTQLMFTLLKRSSLQPWPGDLGKMFNTSDKLSVLAGYTCHGLHSYLDR